MLKNFWYAMALATEVTTKPTRVSALGNEFVLYRTTNGTPVVMSDLCVHRGGALSDGWTEGDCVVCPYHGWRYEPDGACNRIPANLEGVPVPRKARVDSYPVQEKYGFVWAFLGDLPEEERPPMPVFKEWDDPKYKKLWGDYWWPVHYTRSVENGMDISHAPFVHAGSFGNPDEPEVEEYEVEYVEWGANATVHLNPPPAKGLYGKLRGGKKERPRVRTMGGFLMPNITRLQVDLPFGDFVLYTCHLPVGKNQTRSIWLQMRSFFTGNWADKDSTRRVIKIFNEDRRTVLSQRPELLPYDLGAELHVRSDAIQIAFRKMHNSCIDRGWGIDTHLIESQYANVQAVVIPSPARKSIPELEKAWVMKEVPTRKTNGSSEKGDSYSGAVFSPRLDEENIKRK
jgi:phenylpropionate dioxygenase-like ring-hydroxylating dioxygenase large terminal subunit